jgi:hypothetical protein
MADKFAVCLLKHFEHLQDRTGENIDLPYVRARNGAAKNAAKRGVGA